MTNTMKTAATAADFARWTERATAMTIAELLWSARDAREAAAAVDAHDEVAAGRYRDEALTYEQEIAARRRAS